MASISLVIPGRNCEATIELCVEAAVIACRAADEAEVLYVDDGSTDASAARAAAAGATVMASPRRGAGAARNAGWRAARFELVWFVDSDCVARPDALGSLLQHFEAPEVGAVSGAYDNAAPDSFVATLIHEEIAARHRAMPQDVDFLASFCVVYRRDVLEQLGGFDERYLRGQDADLSFRAVDAGHRLRFDRRSRVAHFHERRLLRYLRAQYHQGYWRAFLHTEHKGHAGGDSYSKLSDHLQPPVALLLLCAPAAFLFVAPSTAALCTAATVAILLALPLGTARKIAPSAGVGVAAAHVPFSALRAFWRGVGFTLGFADKLTRAPNRSAPRADDDRPPPKLARWLPWLIGAHLTWGLARLPGKVFSRRVDEVVRYQKLGPEGWFFRDDAMQGQEVITWLREHTPEACVVAWEGERLGAMEFAVGLLAPRFFVRANEAERVAETTGVPIAAAELDGRRGRITVSATRERLEVSVR